MISPDPKDVELGREAIARGILDRDRAKAVLEAATARRCGFIAAGRQLGAIDDVAERALIAASPTGTVPPPQPSSSAARALNLLPKPGESIGSYVIERVLGQGGMGAVYIGRNEAGAHRAITVPLFDPKGRSVERRARFEREARALAKLEPHPNIVRVHAVGEDQGLAFCVLELVEGEGLEKIVAREQLEVDRALALAEQIARALAHVHRSGIIHRDVKPANVIVRATDGTAVLMDFGLARDDDADALTRTGTMLGTPAYMSPEQAAGKKSVDHRADLYSLGATLCELLTGLPPFDADTQMELISKILSEVPAPPSKRRAAIPADVDAIVMRALEKDPAERYATAVEMASDIARARKGEPIRRSSVGTRVARRLRSRLGAAIAVAGMVAVTSATAVVVHEIALPSSAGTEAWLREVAECRAAIEEARDPLRAERVGLRVDGDPAPLERALDRGHSLANDARARGAPEEQLKLATDVQRARLAAQADAALAKRDGAAALAAASQLPAGDRERELLTALATLASGKTAEARASLEELARDRSVDRVLSIEAGLGAARAELAQENPRAALHAVSEVEPRIEPGWKRLRAGAVKLRAQSLADLAVAAARSPAEDPLPHLDALLPLGATGWRAAATSAIEALAASDARAPRATLAALEKIWDKDPEPFAEPRVARPLMDLSRRLHAKHETLLAARACSLAMRGDLSLAHPAGLHDALWREINVRWSENRYEDVVELELASVAIFEATEWPGDLETKGFDLVGFLEKRIAARPRDWTSRLILAERFSTRAFAGRGDRALQLLAQVLDDEHAPPFARAAAIYQRADCAGNLGQVDKQIADLEAALEAGYARPDVAELRLADHLLRKGKLAPSIEWARKAVRDADDRAARDARGWDGRITGRAPGLPLGRVERGRQPPTLRARIVLANGLMVARRFDEIRTLLDEIDALMTEDLAAASAARLALLVLQADDAGAGRAIETLRKRSSLAQSVAIELDALAAIFQRLDDRAGADALMRAAARLRKGE